MKWLKKLVMGSIQVTAIIGILFFGIVAAGWILSMDPPMSVAAEGDEHDDHDDHESNDDHDDHDDHESSDDHDEEGADLSVEQMERAGVTVDSAAEATLLKIVPLNGMITPNQERLVHVVPRFPGIIKSVEKSVGSLVEKDDILLRIESNESLQLYDISTPIAGTVIERDAALGEFVTEEDRLMIIADLEKVWVDFRVYQRDFDKLAIGQKVDVLLSSGDNVASGVISYISPFGSADTQSMLARVVLDNAEGELRPGLFVTGRVRLDPRDVAVAVKTSAIQYLDGEPVVFVREGENFVTREIIIGYRDSSHAEVLSGVLPGELYVSENSFLLKAELGKGLAEHEH